MSERVVIAGVPCSGSDLYSEAEYDNVRHTSTLVDTHGWSEMSEEVSGWLSEPGPWVIEGVATVRSMRKWMKSNSGKPCDRILWFPESDADYSSGQMGLYKGTHTIWRGIVADLMGRGVVIEEMPPYKSEEG